MPDGKCDRIFHFNDKDANLAGRKPCRAQTLQDANLAGRKPCRTQTLQGANLAGRKPCRAQTLRPYREFVISAVICDAKKENQLVILGLDFQVFLYLRSIFGDY